MKITVYKQKNAKSLQITAWIITGLNSVYACFLVFLIGLWIPRLWLIAIPWILVIFAALFWELITGVVLSLGGIGGIIWYLMASFDGWYVSIAFIVPIISGLLLITAWFLNKKKS